jgi:hypothetical protein
VKQGLFPRVPFLGLAAGLSSIFEVLGSGPMKGLVIMSLPASGPRKSPLDRVLGRRHVAFWSVLGSIAAVITLIVAFTGTSSPSNKPPAGRSPIPPASTPSAPQSSQAAGRATPTATAGAPSGAGGTELTHYDVTVAVGYGINFTSGSSQPINLSKWQRGRLGVRWGRLPRGRHQRADIRTKCCQPKL